MKILSWNVRGLGWGGEESSCEQIIRSWKPDLLIQESKINSEERIVKDIWGGIHIRWVILKAIGSSGGILFLWDTR